MAKVDHYNRTKHINFDDGTKCKICFALYSIAKKLGKQKISENKTRCGRGGSEGVYFRYQESSLFIFSLARDPNIQFQDWLTPQHAQELQTLLKLFCCNNVKKDQKEILQDSVSD